MARWVNCGAVPLGRSRVASAPTPHPHTDETTFPATRGERAFVAVVVAAPVAVLVGLAAGYSLGPPGGVAVGALMLVGVAAYVLRFTAAAAPAPVTPAACASCSAPFVPTRPSQRYCSVRCRRRAAADRRRATTRALARERTSAPRERPSSRRR